MFKKKNIIKIVASLVIIGVAANLVFRNKVTGQLNIVKWENVYNENNILFHYSDSEHEKLVALNDLYQIKTKVSKEVEPLNKAIILADFLNEIVTYDDVANLKGTNGIDILIEKDGKTKTSGRDMAIIYRDFLTIIGLNARVGEFRKTDAKSINQKSYFVVEFWSERENKWVMIDFMDVGYFEDQGFLVGAMEVLDGQLRNFNYTGKSEKGKYINNIKGYLDTYTIGIDNTVDRLKSNSFIMYVEDLDDIVLQFKGKYINPTIYTENLEVMLKNPMDNSLKEDELAYMILMKDVNDEALSDEENYKSFILGGFKNSSIMTKYYIKKNDGEFIEINDGHTKVNLVKGLNTFEISVDGVNTINKIEIKFK